MATAGATWGYRNRYGDAFGRTYFRRFGPGVVSSVGIGTHLGDPTDAVDERYRAAVAAAFEGGINVVDTAVNYRAGRSERAVAAALREAAVDREAVVVATKGGFLPFDGDPPADPAAYVRREFVEPGLVAPDELARGSHCLAPEFLGRMLDRSLATLGLDAVDLHYVHNPETQLAVRSAGDVYDRLEAAFRLLEARRAAGDLGRYGVASWDAFRVPPDHDRHLSLAAVHERARAAADAAGADEPGLAAIQLPFNVGMADAFTVAAHPPPDGAEGGSGEGARVSALEYARRAGLSVFASASLGQGTLADGLPEPISGRLAGDTPAQRAINFARSAPAVTCALVGTSSPAHVRENVAAGTFDPMGAAAFDETFE
jgi:aryl-alcohol dehydrogenase-like predicted oxidoreductase